ncbi:MAG: glycosyltransferase [Lutibacter sp.]
MVSIIYAYRNRELKRIKASLDSLRHQTNKSFEVIFVDYGSKSSLANQIEELMKFYSFAIYNYLPTETMLWNKSKALNFGIKNANNPFIFIADVDIIFSPKALDLIIKNTNPYTVNLFTLNYLSQKESQKLYQNYNVDELVINHTGIVNGLVLASKEAIYKVHGYDEFFHFYGAEDVDLYTRLENAGYDIRKNDVSLFYHNCHEIYNSYDDSKMSSIPRLFNIKRINQQHYLYHKKNKNIIPEMQENWGEMIDKDKIMQLNNPDVFVQLKNVQSEVIHFFEVELGQIKNKIIKIQITEEDSQIRWKNNIKKWMGKSTVSMMTIKECNDLILSKIVNKYRNHYYSYRIAKTLNQLTLIIQL